jgi:hypothetical protein
VHPAAKRAQHAAGSCGIGRLAERPAVQEDLGVGAEDQGGPRDPRRGVQRHALGDGARLRAGQRHHGVGRRAGRQRLGDPAWADGERDAQAREELLPAG